PGRQIRGEGDVQLRPVPALPPAPYEHSDRFRGGGHAPSLAPPPRDGNDLGGHRQRAAPRRRLGCSGPVHGPTAHRRPSKERPPCRSPTPANRPPPTRTGRPSTATCASGTPPLPGRTTPPRPPS